MGMSDLKTLANILRKHDINSDICPHGSIGFIHTVSGHVFKGEAYVLDGSASTGFWLVIFGDEKKEERITNILKNINEDPLMMDGDKRWMSFALSQTPMHIGCVAQLTDAGEFSEDLCEKRLSTFLTLIEVYLPPLLEA
ncbi:hypothetical protein ACFL0K_01720 [Patescibacteria group bacterium]